MFLYCIRHGESVYNAEGRVQGQSDVPLSELGLRQGAAVAEALADTPLEVIFSSPLRRAMQTAEVIAQRFDVAIRVDPRLKEVNAGIFQDRLRSELAREHPVELARWKSEDLDYALPGGETRRQLAQRGRAAFETIAAEPYHQVAVVAHGRLLIATLKSLLEIPADQPPFSLGNGSVTTIECGGPDGFEVVKWDRTEHLEGLGPVSSGDL